MRKQRLPIDGQPDAEPRAGVAQFVELRVVDPNAVYLVEVARVSSLDLKPYRGAPAEVVAREREKAESYRDQRDRLSKKLADLT